jgi:hypothetical protein
MSEAEEDDRMYKVVVNHEEQYSIWFADREPPAGWREVGKQGLKQQCLDPAIFSSSVICATKAAARCSGEREPSDPEEALAVATAAGQSAVARASITTSLLRVIVSPSLAVQEWGARPMATGPRVR